MIGTPFVTKDEIHNRKIEHLDKKPWEQEARDDQGRKHFYGAFTGALHASSVGYKGTVGSKEGFQPKKFVSSRRDRQKKAEEPEPPAKQQDILEFMDEEDLGEHHMPGSAQGQQPSVPSSKADFGGVTSVRSNCGRKGREILCSLMGKPNLLEDEDSGSDSIKAKRDEKFAVKLLGRNGLGYEPSKQELELARLQQEKVQANRQFPGRPSAAGASLHNSKVIKMAEFNEDDQDVEDDADGEHMTQVYSRDTLSALKSKSNYTEMQQEYVNLTNQKVKSCQFVVGGLLRSDISADPTTHQSGLIPIRPPPGFNPFSEAQKQKAEKPNIKAQGIMNKGRSKLDAFSRSKLLEGCPQQDGSKSRLPDGMLNLVPFEADEDKLKRFEAHYLEDQGQLIVFDVPNNMMTGSQMRKERDEFNQILTDFKDLQKKKFASYQVYTSKDKKQDPAAVGTDEAKKGQLDIKMESFDWQPERLLILRFGLQNLVTKRKMTVPADKQGTAQQQQRPVGFRKAGDMDITGDDYFNKIKDQFGLTTNGQEQVKSEESQEINPDDDNLSPTAQQQDIDEDEENKGCLVGTTKKALLDSIFNDDS